VRLIGLTGLIACLALPASALAQGATGSPMMDVGQVLRQAEQPLTQWAPPPSLLTKLPRASRGWMRAETQRQVQAPREPVDLLLVVDKTMGKDIKRLSKQTRIHPHEILVAVVLKIVMDAETKVANAPKGLGHEPRLAVAAAHRKEVIGWASENSLLLAAMELK